MSVTRTAANRCSDQAARPTLCVAARMALGEGSTKLGSISRRQAASHTSSRTNRASQGARRSAWARSLMVGMAREDLAADMVGELIEAGLRQGFHGPRARQVDVDDFLYAAGARRHHQDAVGQ